MLRSVLFWLHLVAGVLAGAIILLMSATGVLLTYEKQLIRWADMRQLKAVSAPASIQLTADSLLRLATSVRGGKSPASMTVRSGADAPVLVSFGQAGVVYLDPYTGAVLGAGNPTVRAFFAGVTEWHRWIAGKDEQRKLGKQVTGVANLLFLVLVLSGMVLWLPRTWSWIRVRSVLWFRAGLEGKARDFNWHNVLGIWSALPLIAIVASATVIGYPWASDLVYKVVGESPPPRNTGAPTAVSAAVPAPSTAPAPAVSYAAALATAVPLMEGWRTATLQIPKPDAKTISITLDRGTGGQPHLRSTVQIATASGAIDKFQPFDSLTTGRQLRNVLRFTHTGEVLGLFGQTLAGLVSFASVVLVVTGVTLAIRRAARAVGRRSGSRGSRPAVTVAGH